MGKLKKDEYMEQKVALIGEVNAGKSSLFNQLVGMERAIVSSIPGTTRDIIEKSVYINGLEVCFLIQLVRENIPMMK